MSKLFVLYPRPTVRPVKAVALKAFTLVRRAQQQAAKIPVQAHAIANDVREAWRESASPNV